jgi:tetratricopeptide (TPR) repeat protein
MAIRYLLLTVMLLGLSPAANAAWHEARSKHFTVYADSSSAEIKRYAERLERFDAAVREARGVPDVEPGASTRVTVFLLRDLQELRNVYGDREAGVAGFYLPKASGSVAFVPEKSERGRFALTSESIFFHEYSHHLMLQDADRPLPTWLTEGFAEFFANPRFEPDGSVTIGLPPRYRAEILYSRAFQLPLVKMLAGDYRYLTEMEFETLYGRGWLLTHLLSFDLSRRGQLTRYLDAIQAGVPARKAAEDAFGDLKELDRQLHSYFKRDVFTVSTIPAAKLRVPPVTVRQLTPGEAAMMEAKIRLARGGKKMFARQRAGRAREIARAYPDNASVMTTLAQMELEAGQPAAAQAAAERALQLDPNSDQAMIAKGRAMIELAKATPASANWNAIRSVISKANRMDPENAEPLMLFYRTYTAQGVRPTNNALEGLKYAVALAPQDSELRMELVGELIDRSQFDEARRVLVPLAYSPHQGKWHDAVVALFNLVEARNAAEAKKQWKASLKYFDDD